MSYFICLGESTESIKVSPTPKHLCWDAWMSPLLELNGRKRYDRYILRFLSPGVAQFQAVQILIASSEPIDSNQSSVLGVTLLKYLPRLRKYSVDAPNGYIYNYIHQTTHISSKCTFLYKYRL